MELGSNSHKGNCFYFLCQIGVLNVQVIAAIDIGTNSTRLLVVQRTEAGWVELARKLASTRLGEGIRRGVLLPSAMERTVEAVGLFYREILKSPFFEAIRSRQPYEDDNLLRPCLIIDHPAVLREMVTKYGAHPTHPGADKLLNELAAGLDEYARRMKEIYDPIWRKASAKNI